MPGSANHVRLRSAGELEVPGQQQHDQVDQNDSSRGHTPVAIAAIPHAPADQGQNQQDNQDQEQLGELLVVTCPGAPLLLGSASAGVLLLESDVTGLALYAAPAAADAGRIRWAIGGEHGDVTRAARPRQSESRASSGTSHVPSTVA